jgi:ribosomal RNA-processing protein 36
VPLSSRKSHDPRFLSTTGNLDSHLHAQSYDFLPGMLAEEMNQLRTSLVAAQKLEKNCPLRDKPTRTAEREAIERDVARLRTKLDKQKRETREREVMADVKREERKKREEGKGAWYMKKGTFFDILSSLLPKGPFHLQRPRAGCMVDIEAVYGTAGHHDTGESPKYAQL